MKIKINENFLNYFRIVIGMCYLIYSKTEVKKIIIIDKLDGKRRFITFFLFDKKNMKSFSLFVQNPMIFKGTKLN